MRLLTQMNADVLVIGGGGAGLAAAIGAAKHGANVMLVSQSPAGYGNNTAIAAGNMCAVVKAEDSPEAYFKDVVSAGRFINDQKLVHIMAENSRQQLSELVQLGVDFIKRDGDLVVSAVPGHSYPRGVAAAKKGMGFTIPLRAAAIAIGVRMLEGMFVTKLVGGGVVQGCIAIDREGKVYLVKAKAVVLATGGVGRLYLKTSTAVGTTGDGYVLAYDAGASLQDMEMVQFYPTATSTGVTGQIILYETIISQMGAVIRNSVGEDVIEKYGLRDPARMTRDRLAQAMMTEVLAGRDVKGGLTIDFSHLSEETRHRVRSLLPTRAGCDGEAGILVTPVTHFEMGGVHIGEDCATGVPGLFAAGEVCGGVHGANRLGGTSLTEIFVFGSRAGQSAALRALNTSPVEIDQSDIDRELRRIRSLGASEGRQPIEDLWYQLSRTMWFKVGIVRSGESLREALASLRQVNSRLDEARIARTEQLTEVIKLRNGVTVAEMIIRSALMRTESRGAHYRTDCPEESAEWLSNVVIRKQGDAMTAESRPTELPRLKP